MTVTRKSPTWCRPIWLQPWSRDCRRPKNHGRGARRYARARLRAGGSATAQSDACVSLREGNCRLLHRRPNRARRAKWQDDPEAQPSCPPCEARRRTEFCVLPVYAVSEDAASTILDLSATLGVDYLIIGASQRTAMAKLLRGSVVTNVAQQLPDSIKLIIYG